MYAFILCVVAFTGTMFMISNPIGNAVKQLEGRKQSEINQAISDWFEQAPQEQIFGKVIYYGCFTALALLLVFVVQPWFTISALAGNMGNRYFGYVSLGVIATNWVIIFKPKKKKKDIVLPARIHTSQGTQLVRVTLVNEKDDIIAVPSRNRLVRTGRDIFFAIPNAYLWYLFLIAIHVIG